MDFKRLSTLLLGFVLSMGTANATLIDFEGLVSNSDSFDNLGLNTTYYGHTWSATNSAQSPIAWGAREGSGGGVSAFSGTGFAWTYNGGQSMFIDFSSSQFVMGAFFAGMFNGNNSTTIQMFGYDSNNTLLASSSVLNLALGQWQNLSGGSLISTAIDRLEIRSDRATSWFAIDDLNIREASNITVPEPSTLAIFSLCIMGFASRCFKKKV